MCKSTLTFSSGRLCLPVLHHWKQRKIIAGGSCSPGVCNSTYGTEAAQKGRCCCQGNKRVQKFWASSPGLPQRVRFGSGRARRTGGTTTMCPPTGQNSSSGTQGSAGIGSATSHQLKPDRACFCLAEVPAAFIKPSDKVQAKRKKSRPHFSVQFQISNCSPLNCCFFAIIQRKSVACHASINTWPDRFFVGIQQKTVSRY